MIGSIRPTSRGGYRVTSRSGRFYADIPRWVVDLIVSAESNPAAGDDEARCDCAGWKRDCRCDFVEVAS